MPKKVIKTEPVYEEEPAKSGNSFFDYLRFGESYTSLILGIIVVIISTALLLSFFNNRNATPTNTVTQDAQSIAQISQRALQLTVTPRETGTVDTQAAQTGPSTTIVPTTAPTTNPTAVPTMKPTNAPTVKPTETKKVAQATTAPTAAPTKAPAKEETKISASGEYTVKAGDSLWTIAERQYKSGYNWVDIARANNLSNPGQITVNQKLKMPKVTAKAPTGTNVAQKEQKNTSNVANKITGNSYKVVKGDSLWTIAIRAYGNGFKWTEIAQANKLANPSVIHPGNTLNLPRGK